VYALDSNRLIRSSKKQAARNTGIGVRKRRVTRNGFPSQPQIYQFCLYGTGGRGEDALYLVNYPGQLRL
jgi:hypothetical protein